MLASLTPLPVIGVPVPVGTLDGMDSLLSIVQMPAGVPVATVAVNEFIFKQPVGIGDLLSFFAHVSRIGRTSLTVDVEVYAERFADQGRHFKVTEARLTYVALDAQGRPKPLPQHLQAQDQTQETM